MFIPPPPYKETRTRLNKRKKNASIDFLQPRNLSRTGRNGSREKKRKHERQKGWKEKVKA